MITMKVGVINVGLGNIGSIVNILRRLGVRVGLVSSGADCLNVDIIILPGVGHFDEGRRALDRADIVGPLMQRVCEDGVPILGICLGMQLLCGGSEEGDMPGLGIVDALVNKFVFPSGSGLKVPHMGWNVVSATRANDLFSSSHEQRFYFVHSYKVIPNDSQIVIGVANHGEEFCAAFQQGRVFGVQFHPEKSHRFGVEMMQSFVKHQSNSF